MSLSDVKIIRIPDIIIGILPINGRGHEAEVSTVLSLLQIILQKRVNVMHNKDGKPFIEGYNISISHTQGWATVILSEKHNVGIDIEYKSDRVCRVAKRFLRDDEPYIKTNDILYVWCAKESLYKLHSSLHLGFQDMRVDVEAAVIYDLRTRKSIPIFHYSTSNYLLTYVWE